jgi:2,3-bisphosphoglycerate-independent phosphoglycerate mutase
MTPPSRKVLLLILDGAGYHPDAAGNAVTSEHLPLLFERMSSDGFAVLQAAELAVGLETGQVGNSEAGHLTIGAGRVVSSMCRHICESFEDGSWGADPFWRSETVGAVLHVVGLLSDAGVHALDRTMAQAAELASVAGLAEVIVHPVLDGVDSLARSAPRILDTLRGKLADLPHVRLGVIMGRKWFCDRGGDLSITRVAADAFRGITELPSFSDAALAEHLETAGEMSFPPHLVEGGRTIDEGEAVLLTSHRADRARQIATVLSETQPLAMLVDPGATVPVKHIFFPQRPLDTGLAHLLKERGIPSVRIAEKCKFPHVTFFFNGFDAGVEGTGICVPSIPEGEIPDKPEMSLPEVTDEIVRAMEDEDRRMIVANLANLDQVGHLGRLDLCAQAAHEVDAAYERLTNVAAANGWTVLITADHGNADRLVGDDGSPFGSHTHRPVPFVSVPAPGLSARWVSKDGSLANVAATVLAALDEPVPEWMEPSLIAFEG